MSTHLPECFETWQIPRKCNICDALRACEQQERNRRADLLRACEPRERNRVISEVYNLACGVTFNNLRDERFFFESLHAMKTPACQISDTEL